MIAFQDLAAIPGFIPERAVGNGGQGLACLGRLDGDEVVVKVLDPALFNPIAWKHAQEASTVRHENVIPILSADAVDIAGQIYRYVVMPYVQGKTLADELEQGRLFSLEEALRRGAELADGLGAFHLHHQEHRDVKPGNIMMPEDGRGLVLIDLELVHYDDFPTVTGRGMLTKGYAAPEYSTANQIEYRSDLFCLGIVLYELLTGRHPFADNSWPETQVRIDRGDLPDPLPAAVPADIAKLLRRLLAHDIFARPATAAEVARTLRTPAPGRRLFGDMAMGLRVSNAQTIVKWCCDEGEELDLVVANASSKTGNVKLDHLRPDHGRLLIDPNTDLFAADQTRDRFPVSIEAWGWEPRPLKNSLLNAVDDAKLARSILQWQNSLGADGLITPYLRLERWTTTPGEDLVRTAEIAKESVRIANASWPDKPVFAGLAVPYTAFTTKAERLAILTTLTGLDPKPDGIYYVLQDGLIDSDFLAALRHTGHTLKEAGLQTILAYAGPELLPLLASGSWDVAVTGSSGSQRHPRFELQLGGPTRANLKKWVLVTHLLEDMRDSYLRRVDTHDHGLIPCGCSGCQAMLSTGTLVYDRDSAERHYVAAMNRRVRDLRRFDPGVRTGELRKELLRAIARAEKIDQTQPPSAIRFGEKARLDPWISTLLQ
jgi:serine/threonine protein kinase